MMVLPYNNIKEIGNVPYEWGTHMLEYSNIYIYSILEGPFFKALYGSDLK
jgi:hypothetical protein